MGLRTPHDYREGLRDGRRVFYRGAAVSDVVEHPELRPAVDHSALCYSIAADRPDLAVRKDTDLGEYSAFYHQPFSPEDLRARGALIDVRAPRESGCRSRWR